MEFTQQQLIQYNGTNPSKPIQVAIKGRVFEMSPLENPSTGPAVPTPCLLAKTREQSSCKKMSKNEEDVCASLDGLSEKEIGALNDRKKKFEAKYPVVGRVAS